MEIISHRVNTIESLKDTPFEFGVEIDIRTYGRKLILAHEPFSDGTDFLKWIKYYSHGTLILNIKEEGLENFILKIMKESNIKNFFFLDQSLPFLIKTIKSGERRSAVRLSEYESIETVLKFTGIIDWVWVDCFNNFSISKAQYKKLKESGFKLCLVSPELQGHNKSMINEFKEVMQQEKIFFDAICTKYSEMWK